MSEPIDVTSQVEFWDNDEEWLPIKKCVCGEKFDYWSAILNSDPADAWECPACKRKLYFRASIRVFEVKP